MKLVLKNNEDLILQQADGGGGKTTNILESLSGLSVQISGVTENTPVISGTGAGSIKNKVDVNVASGVNSVALGSYTKASKRSCFANGTDVFAEGTDSMAIGRGALALGDFSFVRGGNWRCGCKITGEANATTYTVNDDGGDKYYFRWIYDHLGQSGINSLMSQTYICKPTSVSDEYFKIVSSNLTKTNGVVTGTITLDRTVSTSALTDYSMVIVTQIANGKGAVADGNGCMALARSAHAEGEQTITLNQAEHADGMNNLSHKANSTFGNAGNTIRSIGIGADASQAKNAVEVMQNGDLYVKGVGGYDGTNPTSGVNDVVTTVNKMAPIMEVTYAELKALRDGSQLIPGKFYRITDYVTTTVQTDTQSAGNQFDIIVRADSLNVLNENATAALHSGDTYFSTAGAKLEAWELKYCLDNDTNRFEWADSTNGKGVIWWMKDDNDNECYYDFKNIMFKVGAKSQVGTIDNVYYYTFSIVTGTNDSSVTDHSLNKNYCYKNTIGKYINTNKLSLPKNVFRNISTSMICYSNTFGTNCYSNTFGTNCRSNTFGNNCYSNTFGTDCYHNTFRNNCYSNTFETSCRYHTFGTDCHHNTFGNNCRYNTFGSSCSSNIFGNDCRHDIFRNICNSNTFGTGCERNIFGSSCSYNVFGTDCKYNIFENACSRNAFGTNCCYNTFGTGCSRNAFGLPNNTKSYYKYIIIERGNQNIYLDCLASTSSDNYLQNIKIAQGINNTDTYKTITHPTINDEFQTEYKAAGSQTVLI